MNENHHRGPYRLEAKLNIRWAAPLHVGTGQRLSVVTDAPCQVDASGRPCLPGSSIRGVLRDWCEREASLLGVDGKAVSRLFGSSSADRKGRLTVLDAVLSEAPTEIRDHVRIKKDRGVADRGGKFDLEVAWPTGANFVLIYEGDDPKDPEVLLLKSAVSALQEGVLSFGGKSGWGLGQVGECKVQWSTHRRDKAPGLADYLSKRFSPGKPSPDESIDWPEEKASMDHQSSLLPWCWLRLDLTLEFEGPFLSAGLFRETEGPLLEQRSKVDDVYYTTPSGRPGFKGSSLRGVMRAQARRIASTVGRDCLVDVLFGRARGEEGAKGLVSVGEGCARGETHAVHSQHIALDRILGFAVPNHLFEDVALASPSLSHRILIRWHPENSLHNQALGLLLMVLRDMEQGLVWAASRTTRGCGHLKSIVLDKAAWSLVLTASAGEAGAGRKPRRFKRSSTEVREGPRSVKDIESDLDSVLSAWFDDLTQEAK